MDTLNTILWSTSLILAVIGITFGIVASINSSKANDKIKNILTISFVAKEAQRAFFDNIKQSNLINKRILKLLKEKASYDDYSILASQARFVPLSNSTIKIIRDTEYKELMTDYISIKRRFDDNFQEIITDFSILSTKKLMTKEHKELLIDYHKEMIRKAVMIITRYDQIMTFTHEIPLKKK